MQQVSAGFQDPGTCPALPAESSTFITVSEALPLHAFPERQFHPVNRIETNSVCSTMQGARGGKTQPLHSKDGWTLLRLPRKQ